MANTGLAVPMSKGKPSTTTPPACSRCGCPVRSRHRARARGCATPSANARTWRVRCIAKTTLPRAGHEIGRPEGREIGCKDVELLECGTSSKKQKKYNTYKP